MAKRNPGLEFANAFGVKGRVCIVVNSFLLTTPQQFCKRLFSLSQLLAKLKFIGVEAASIDTELDPARRKVVGQFVVRHALEPLAKLRL